ncbi:MAG TPA: hypothetical protein ENF75_04635 [Acidilobales archaeon]|nr:hypothetical protein [Acidilobales archaeon]
MIELSSEVKKLGIYLTYATVGEVHVEKDRVDVAEYTKKIINEVLERYTLESLTRHPIVKAYRRFMWRLGIDPTKVRPSSEALVRRILRTKSLRNINNVVDSGNFASIETLVPIGIYDLAKLRPPLLLRYAKRGEHFLPIGGREEVLKGNEVVLADSEKIVHIFPHRDSIYSAVSEETKSVLIVSAGVPAVPKQLAIEAVKKTINYIKVFASGRKESEVVVVD